MTAREPSVLDWEKLRPPHGVSLIKQSISRPYRILLMPSSVKDNSPGGHEASQVEDLMLLGTSMGGARPKTVVEDSEGLWLAKFNRTDDRWNHARVEHSCLELARGMWYPCSSK